MEKYNDLDVHGQLLFVDPRWVTGETCLFKIDDPFTYAKAQAKLYKMRSDFVLRLQKEGFVIIYDESDMREDIISLTMNRDSICEDITNVVLFKRELDKRMFEVGGENLHYPSTLRVEEYFNNPFFPAVFKNEIMNGGIDKFLIETPEQVEIIKKFYEKSLSYPKYAEIFGCSIFQQLIETPTDSKTYMRVLMSASGDVMGASLKYSKAIMSERDPEGMFEPYFLDENSEYYLNCQKMFNYYSGGGNISFCQPRYSYEKQQILEAHGIDPDNPMIPSDVLDVSSSIAQKCNRELGVMCGIDFILNKNDNKWYYLEIQGFPAIEEWADTKNIKPIKVKTTDDYIKYLELDLEARHDALMMCMKKKYNKNKMKIKK